MAKAKGALKPAAKASKKSAGKKKGTGKMVTATLDARDTETIEESESAYRRPVPAELRRGAVTIDEIRSLQRMLSEQSVVLGKVAEELQKNAMTSLESVDGVTKGARGRKLVADFTANLNRALSDALYG
jgi:hypothetical protein